MEFRVVFLIWCSITTAYVAATKQPNYNLPDATLLSLASRTATHSLHEDESQLVPERQGGVGRKNQGGWSGWSEWSTCSRSCDGGVAHQLRRCHSPHGCKGESLRYKICNMQPCPDSQDFRAHQCSAYDDVSYDGALYKWSPHYDYNEPCALTCRGRPSHLSVEATELEETPSTGTGGEDTRGDRRIRAVDHHQRKPPPEDVVDGGGERDEPDAETEDADEVSVVVQLAPRVQDGTRCRIGSLDMCIQGKCQRVGCDLKIGSTKKVDACGVCGGDGSSCSQPQYHWDISENALCSATCGGGYRMVKPICKHRISGQSVDESLCRGLVRPEPSVLHCNTHQCPAKWIAEEWGPCSKVCGSGFRERRVVCAEDVNGVKSRVEDSVCKEPKLATRELCNVHQCPEWETSDWSGCSVSCGKGIQVRNVECILANGGGLSAHCDPHTKPPAMQSCTTGISCNKYDLKLHAARGGSEEEEDEEDDDDEMDDAPYPEPRTLPLTGRQEMRPRTERLSTENQQKIPNEATFILDSEWGPCSVTCGEGVRMRPYRCKIFLEFSRTTPTLNDTLCPGPKPADEVEKCYLEPCSMTYGYDPSFPRDTNTNKNPALNDFKVQAAVPGKTYSWHEQGYTSCTASCLGGVEELIINCVRDDTGKVVSPFLCSQETKPEARVRTCNDHQCPPRWNTSDFSPCSKSCGIGIKTREVTCIHEVARGGENTMVVPNSMCPQPIPSDRQYCNVLDCPVRWEVSEWGKCSKNCGGGFKERRVECKQIMAQEHKVERPEAMCPGARPSLKKACNNKPCAPESQRPVIAANNSTYIQHDQKKVKVSLKVGGAAEVFYGVQVKVKCPVKGRFNRTRIHWTKDGSFLVENKRVKVSSKGALRISNITYRDSGVYTCHAGLSAVQLDVTVKPKVGDNASINEYEKYKAAVEIRRNNPDHELPEGVQERQPKQRNKGKGRQKNVQNTDATEGDGLYKSRSQVSPSGATGPGSASSSGSRAMPMPHFKTLLTGLQSFSNSKGYDLLSNRINHFDQPPHRATNPQRHSNGPVTAAVRDRDALPDPQPYYDADEPVEELNRLRGASVIRMKSTAVTTTGVANNRLDDRSSIDHVAGGGRRPLDWRLGQRINALIGDKGGVLLGQGSAQDLKFQWLITPWSECSLPCGMGVGFRLRSAHCVVRLNNISESVDNSLCASAGLQLPETIEGCGGSGCAEWRADEWRPCFKSKCVSWHSAIQRRTVTCTKDGLRVEDSECDRKQRPVAKRECYSEKCKGVWRMEAWSECEGVCSNLGTTQRKIQCVWYGTRKVAGDLCQKIPPPLTMKPCVVPSCPQSSAATADRDSQEGEEDNFSGLDSGADNSGAPSSYFTKTILNSVRQGNQLGKQGISSRGMPLLFMLCLSLSCVLSSHVL